jgi:hypothetical protein
MCLHSKVFADDVLVYSGALPRADRWPSGRALLFTDDEAVIKKYAGQAAAMQSERVSLRLPSWQSPTPYFFFFFAFD